MTFQLAPISGYLFSLYRAGPAYSPNIFTENATVSIEINDQEKKIYQGRAKAHQAFREIISSQTQDINIQSFAIFPETENRIIAEIQSEAKICVHHIWKQFAIIHHMTIGMNSHSKIYSINSLIIMKPTELSV